jgi:thiamine biosynthesis lipoprotein
MKNRVRTGIIAGIGILLLGLLYIRTAGSRPVELDSGYRVVMGTFSRVVVIAPTQRTAEKCIEAAFEVQRRVDELMSYHRQDSELNRVNREAAERPIPVNPLTFEVLQKAVHFSELSDGAFDVTVGPLVDLWKAAGEANVPPTDKALAEARARVGYRRLILDEQNMTVQFAVRGMRVDLGGIGKGYAVDRSVEAMKQRGAVGGMVDLGGNIRCFGQPPRGQEHWRIGVQDPNVAPEDVDSVKMLLVLAMTHESVATSGDYRRFVQVQGTRQSHVIDAGTGKGAEKLAGDTIIAPDATTADALSTAVNVLGPEAGMALIERLPGVEAILVPSHKDKAIIYSSRARAYIDPAERPTHE